LELILIDLNVPLETVEHVMQNAWF